MAKTKAQQHKELMAFKREMKLKGKKVDKDGRVLPMHPVNDKPMKEFWSELDPEQKKTFAIALLDSTDKGTKELAHCILNPGYRKSMMEACRECNVSLQQLNDLWRNHNLSLGMMELSSRLPKVMLDTAMDAESRYEVCPRCDGLGSIVRYRQVDGIEIEEIVECPKCKGSREVRIPGDAKSRDQVFEIAGLTGKSSPVVAIQQNFGKIDSLEDTLNISQKLLQQGD